MTNKKILLFIAGIFFILIFSGAVNSATKEVKIDWNGYPFGWSSYGTNENAHDVETGAYDYPGSIGGYMSESCINGGGYNWWSAIVYNNYWYIARCRASGHGANNHYGNEFGGGYDNNDFTFSSSPPQIATVMCYDSDNDNYYTSVSVLSGINLGISTLCMGGTESYFCDTNANINPGATEICGDGLDNDCSGGDAVCSQVNYCSDSDNDNYVQQTGGCSIPAGKSGGDCDDNDDLRSPGLPEICGDSKDNNCDNSVDEGCIPLTYYYCDEDNDGVNSNLAKSCSGANCIPTGCSASWGYDCVDAGSSQECFIYSQYGGRTDALAYNFCTGFPNLINPSASKQCNGLDANCDGKIYENCNQLYWTYENGNKITTPNANPIIFPSQEDKFKLFLEDIIPNQTSPSWIFNISQKTSNGDNEIYISSSVSPAGNKVSYLWTPTQAQMTDAAVKDPDNIFEFYFIVTGGAYKYTSGILKIDWQQGGSPPSEDCTNTLDDDGDGYTDCADSDCSSNPACALGLLEINCDNTLDDDSDGKVDCADNDCTSNSACVLDTCSQYSFCADYISESECNVDSCQVSPLTGCLWNATSCNSYETQNGIICSYQEIITATCDNSDFLEYSLTSLNPIEDECEEKDPVSIICSSKTKLPLENKFGIILTIILIIGIYSFWFFRRKK